MNKRSVYMMILLTLLIPWQFTVVFVFTHTAAREFGSTTVKQDSDNKSELLLRTKRGEQEVVKF